MNRIVRFFALPLLTLAGAAWLIYDHWIAPDPLWRFPKAEAAGPILLVIAVAVLVYNVRTFARTSRPIVPGMRVMFEVRGGPVVGHVLSVQGTGLVVQTPDGSFQIERNAIDDII